MRLAIAAAGLHLAFALDGVREAPRIDDRPVAVATNVVAVRLGEVELADAADVVAVIAQALVVRLPAEREERVVAERADARNLLAGRQHDAHQAQTGALV